MPKGRHLGSQNGAKIDPKTIQNRSRFSRANKYPSRPSWNRLGAVLGRSWAILTGLGTIFGRFGAGWGAQIRLFSLGFSILFEKSRFGIKMVILAGLGVILGRLGSILGPLGPNLGRLGRPREPKREAKRDPRGTKNETKMTSTF